jgi:peptide/nickel transport system permease protein
MGSSVVDFPLQGSAQGQRWLRRAGRIGGFARRRPVELACGVVLAVLIVTAIFADVIAPYSPTRNDNQARLQSPSASHLAGTDQFGRDVSSRVIHGARISLYVGLTATLLGNVLAIIVGVTSAYFGGVVDYAIQRVVDGVQSIPGLVLLIGLMVVLGPSLRNVIIALAFFGIWGSSRVIRSATLAVKANAYMDAARVIGCSHWRTMLVYIIPNIMPIVIVGVSITIGNVIVAEASLSFLGYGVPPPSPSWGGMMSSEGRAYMLSAPWILIAPTLALSTVVFSFNMIGDALRDRLDPRLRGTGGGFQGR